MVIFCGFNIGFNIGAARQARLHLPLVVDSRFSGTSASHASRASVPVAAVPVPPLSGRKMRIAVSGW
jgi:hypothetical protein